MAALRVAIVGMGPKGLYALERLVAHGHRHSHLSPLELHVYEPGVPGAGAAYDVDQPDFLRLNVTSRAVDAWYRRGAAPSSSRLPDLDTWRGGEPEPLDWGEYPPRALAGRYLAQTWDVATQLLPSNWTMEHRRVAVDRLDRGPRGWRIGVDDYGEVLLAIGHAADWPGALRHNWTSEMALVPAVFPVPTMVGESQVPSGANVAVRGAALTFIDAALALSEGRDGRFSGEGAARAYRRSGREPRTICPVAHTGRLMGAKMAREVLDGLPLEAARAQGLSDAQAAFGSVEAVEGALVDTAAAYRVEAARAWGSEASRTRALHEVEDARGALGSAPVDGTEAELARSVAVAHGELEPDAVWALGQAWRDIYPGIVDALGYESCSARDWARFAALARDLERVAFGPPPVNAAKLLALVRTGLVDLTLLEAGASIDGCGVHLRGEPWPADVVIDAVLPPPGARDVVHPLLAHLLTDRHVRLGQGRRGLVVRPDATCVGADGRPAEGLACIGRPTEDVVIGNDTLVRTLHDGPDLWAERVIGRLAEGGDD